MNQDLLKSNYMVIKNFVEKESAKEMSNLLYKYSLKSYKRDIQVPAAHSVHNPNFGLITLCNKCFEVGNIIGENVFPTYCYSRQYEHGSVLKRHKDRMACEISLTVHLDGDKEWPIWVQTPDDENVSVELESGDALVYLGCVALHWREAYKGNRYSQLFLHYVRSNGACSEAIFDKKRDEVDLSLLQQQYQSLLL
tara:strand:- start:57 stop:641 length:585 start_codon:yes stop_codon:yes gene_type:complete